MCKNNSFTVQPEKQPRVKTTTIVFIILIFAVITNFLVIYYSNRYVEPEYIYEDFEEYDESPVEERILPEEEKDKIIKLSTLFVTAFANFDFEKALEYLDSSQFDTIDLLDEEINDFIYMKNSYKEDGLNLTGNAKNVEFIKCQSDKAYVSFDFVLQIEGTYDEEYINQQKEYNFVISLIEINGEWYISKIGNDLSDLDEEYNYFSYEDIEKE